MERLEDFHDAQTGGFVYSLDAATGEFDYVHAEISGFALSLLARGGGRALQPRRATANSEPGGEPSRKTENIASTKAVSEYRASLNATSLAPAVVPSSSTAPSSTDHSSVAVPPTASSALDSSAAPDAPIAEISPARLAQFLLEQQTPRGGFRHSARRHPALPTRSNEVHVFDTAVCAVALLDFAERFGNGTHRAAAERAVDWLVAEARHPGGWFRAVWLDDVSSWGDARRAGFWSSEGGCYHGKILALLARMGRWSEAERFLSWLLHTQRPDGAWPASPAQSRVHSHAMGYCLEGLLQFHAIAHEAASLDAVHRGMRWLAAQAIRHDGIPAWIPHERAEFRSDSQIQFLRLASALGAPPEWEAACAACVRRLERLRVRAGGWLVGDASVSDAHRPRVAAWATLFDLASRLPDVTPRERLL